MKDDFLYFLHHILLYCGLWVCDAIERGMEGVHSKLHYEGFGFKKGRG